MPSLEKVYCHNPNPVKLHDYKFFTPSDIANATLYVPFGTKADYESMEWWNGFGNIVEMEKISTDIENSYAKEKFQAYIRDGFLCLKSITKKINIYNITGNLFECISADNSEFIMKHPHVFRNSFV